MFGQPRCREWTPLATQQLRTRNLLQIVGYNMQASDNYGRQGSLYYTLHSTTMSAPFYTSEKLLSNHPKWREIDSELIHKMSSVYIVVRVWRHIRQINCPSSENQVEKCHQQSDEIIQTWGVNFSGLLHIGANLSLDYTSKNFKENTLIFQMIGGYFCSYDKLRLQPLPRGSSDPPVVTKAVSPAKKIPINNKHYRNMKESKSVSPSRGTWRSDGYDNNKYVSKSHSPPNLSAFRQNTSLDSRVSSYVSSKIISDSYKDRLYCDSQSDSVYEHSPKSDGDIEIREYSGSDSSTDNLKSCSSLNASNRDLSNIDESETAENFDANLLPIPKCRYSSMKFLKSEIRPSYTAEKLQKLHLLQYSIKNITQKVQEIKEKIYQKSAIENSENLSPNHDFTNYEDFSRSEILSMSSREYSFVTGKKHCKGKDLGKILSETTAVLMDKGEEQKADKRFEESDNSILTDNISRTYKDSFYENTLSFDRRFNLRLNELLEFKPQPSPSQRLRHACLTRQVELSRFKRRLLKDERDATLAKIRQLKDVRNKLFEENQDNGSDLMQKYHSLSRKTDQLKELRKSEDALGELCARSSSLLWSRRWKLVQDIQTIYPIEEDEQGKLRILNIHLPACQSDGDGLRQIPENNLAVALGYVAHVAALAASILSIPLKHPLKLMGSRTKVLDHLSDQQNEIPLFARNKDSTMFRYGLFLLNKNIVQLLWATNRVIPADPKDTLTNLRKLITSTPLPNSLELSRFYGSVSSVEASGTPNYALCHQFSAPSLLPHASSQHTALSLNSSVSTGAIRKIPHHSLRSLVSVGGDRSTRSLMISGGFGNTGGRQFNRFKDSVDGHSPKIAMVIRKHRYSRSVGSYVDEQILQSLETSPTSAIGSEPSLLIHESHTTSNIQSDSPSDDIQNVMSFSESDLTKVSGIVSSETVSPTEECTSKSEEKVLFAVGDDTFERTLQVSKKKLLSKIPKQQSLEENLIQDKNKQDPREVSRLSKENLEIRNLQLDVDQLSKELKQMCDTSPSLDKGRILQTIESVENVESDEVNIRSSETSLKNKGIENNTSLNVAASHLSPCEIIDIEKLDTISYCNEACAENCPHLFEKILNRSATEAIKDDTGNTDDVIVLPSAEAVMTTSSHFNDSIGLFEPLNLNDDSISENENNKSSNHSSAQLENKEDNIETSMNTLEPCIVKLKINDLSERDSVDISDANSINDCFDDNESICVGNNASHDANRLLENLKLIEEKKFVFSDTSSDVKYSVDANVIEIEKSQTDNSLDDGNVPRSNNCNDIENNTTSDIR